MPKGKNKKVKQKLKDRIKKSKLTFKLSEVLVIVIISLLLGILFGSIMVYEKENIIVTQVPVELEEFVSTYENIYDNYYKKVKKEDLVNAALEGMINSLDDPYSVYLEKEDSESFNQTVNGEYVGIGATVKYQEEYAEISALFNNSPAKKVGLQVGDKLIEIDGEKLEGKTLSQITELMKGEKNSKITIKVIRGEEEKTYTLKRTTVSVPSVASKVIEKNGKKIGYLSIDVFSANTYNQFKNNLESLEKKKINAIIIDVRNNPGGQLEDVKEILELLVEKDKVLYQIEKKSVTEKIKDTTKQKCSYQMAILINKGSASASEILASSLKENNNATLVGKTTYGKGTVQKAYELSSGATLKYTTQKWLTSKGIWINEKGITPDEEVELGEEYMEESTDENDSQLQKALEILTK